MRNTTDLLWKLVRSLLFRMDAEQAHHLTLELLSHHPRKLGQLFPATPPRPVRVGSVWWRTPVGLAAGLDKDGLALLFWEHLGFGSIEVGTVTAHPQQGNPRPRLHRLVEHGAIVNRMGFNNAGSAVLATRLQRLRDHGLWPGVPLGINLGKSKITPNERAAEDYLASLERVAGFADWITINVSSPNTPGLRDLQRAESLSALLQPLVQASPVPLWLKLSPDLAHEDLQEAIEAAIEAGVDGLIATNTTLSRPVPSPHAGGLSGRPLWLLASQRVGQLLDDVAGRVPVIGVGGIHGREHLQHHLRAGCAAVQLYSGLIYEGPGLVRRMLS